MVGDIILVLTEEDSAPFHRKNNDLQLIKTISIKNALCGLHFDIHHPDGRILRITTFGESHCDSVGVVIEGLPPKFKISENTMMKIEPHLFEV